MFDLKFDNDFFLSHFQDKAGYNDDFGDSENEAEPDAYLARVKAEGKARDSDDDDGSDSDESTDDDFNPDAGMFFINLPKQNASKKKFFKKFSLTFNKLVSITFIKW